VTEHTPAEMADGVTAPLALADMACATIQVTSPQTSFAETLRETLRGLAASAYAMGREAADAENVLVMQVTQEQDDDRRANLVKVTVASTLDAVRKQLAIPDSEAFSVSIMNDRVRTLMQGSQLIAFGIEGGVSYTLEPKS
jgi:hypothetical protein